MKISLYTKKRRKGVTKKKTQSKIQQTFFTFSYLHHTKRAHIKEEKKES